MPLKQKLIIVAVLGLSTLVLDQATKIWARSALMDPDKAAHIKGDSHEGKKRAIGVLGDRPGIEFRLSYNTGAAFGLFSDTAGSRIFLSLIGFGALFLIFYLLRRPESDAKVFVYALACVTGGALGNLIDRIAMGKVTDFVWVWLTDSVDLLWPWPAFNVADIALVVGVGLMLISVFFVRGSQSESDEAKAGAGKKRGGKARSSKAKGTAAGKRKDGGKKQ